MIDISFWVNLLWIKYFRNKLNQNKSINLCLSDAQKKYWELVFLRNNLWSNINKIIENVFWKIDHSLRVEVYPEYFFLWAINIKKGIIVLWQPSKSMSFYWWLLLHEIVHFLLKDKWLNRCIEEIICFSFERMFILEHDEINIDVFNYEQSSDELHKVALTYSNIFFDIFISFYNNQDINWFVAFLNKSIDAKDKSLNTKNSLTAYLLENG